MQSGPSTAPQSFIEFSSCVDVSQSYFLCGRGQHDDKQLAGRSSRPARNRTKKVTGGATDEELAEHAARPRPLRPQPIKQLPRSKAKGRANSSKMRGVGKNINEAAEALLGMGIGFAEDDMLVSLPCYLLQSLLRPYH